MRHRKPVDILALHEKRERTYRFERRMTRFGLYVVSPAAAAAFLAIKLSGTLEIHWPETIVPPVGLAIFCLLGWGCAELSWKGWCRQTASPRASAAAGNDT